MKSEIIGFIILSVKERHQILKFSVAQKFIGGGPVIFEIVREKSPESFAEIAPFAHTAFQAVAAAYTLVLHAALFFPITILGALYMWRDRVTWDQFAEAKRERQAEAA